MASGWEDNVHDLVPGPRRTRSHGHYMPVYLDCSATTPVDPRVGATVTRHMVEEYGNAGSRTHEFGARAKRAVQRAREQVAISVDASPDEVFFTSGTTESNNLALLGLATFGERVRHRHVISTLIEHKAVLEPLSVLRARGFEVDLVPPTSEGWVDPESIGNLLRPDTLVVSVMHANNETGVVQPIEAVSELLVGHSAFLHVDAAQTYGKLSAPLSDRRIDLISLSGHKLFAPKGIGALIARRRGYDRPPLTPLMFGGGQERGLRPGTLPVALVVGLGLAVELAREEEKARRAACLSFRTQVLEGLRSLEPRFNGDVSRTLSHVVNLSFDGIDSEAAMVALKDLVAVSNGSACTSANYEPSHVLQAMGLSEDRIKGALRLSWAHMTEAVDWDRVVARLLALRGGRAR